MWREKSGSASVSLILSWIIEIAIVVLIGWKLIRITGFLEYGMPWAFHHVLIPIFLIFLVSTSFDKNFFVNKIFLLFAVFLVFTIVRIMLFGEINSFTLATLYFALVVCIVQSGHVIPFERIQRILENSFLAILFFSFVDVVSAIYSPGIVFDYNINFLYGVENRSGVSGDSLLKQLLFMDNSKGLTRGISGSIYTTSALLLASVFFWWSSGRKVLFVFSCILLMFYSSYSTYLVAVILGVLYSNKWVAFKILGGLVICGVLIASKNPDLSNWFDILFPGSWVDFVVFLIIGEGVWASILNTEFRLLTLPIKLGLSFWILAFVVWKCFEFRAPEKDRERIKGLRFCLLSLIFCGWHYSVLFTFPNILIFFLIVGHLLRSKITAVESYTR